MRKNDLNQIKGSNLKELAIKVNDLKKELVNLVMDKNMKKLKNIKSITKAKKDLAQVLTIVRQKQLLEILEASQPKEKLAKKGSNKS